MKPMKVTSSNFEVLPVQLRAWVVSRAIRRILPFYKRTYCQLEGSYPAEAKGMEKTILLTELFAYDARIIDDASWFRPYCMHLQDLSEKHYFVPFFCCLVNALLSLKPRYCSGPLGAGTVSGNFHEALKGCSKVVASADLNAGVESHEAAQLKEDWILHLESDIDHYVEIAESLDNGTDLLRRLSLSELGLVFTYLPDSFAEQQERDTNYQRSLFATDSFMNEVLNRA